MGEHFSWSRCDVAVRQVLTGSSRDCADCRAGTFSIAGQALCSNCGAGKYGSASGQVRPHRVLCHVRYYIICVSLYHII
jgi:hypothetical protein